MQRRSFKTTMRLLYGWTQIVATVLWVITQCAFAATAFVGFIYGMIWVHFRIQELAGSWAIAAWYVFLLLCVLNIRELFRNDTKKNIQ